MLLLWDHLLLTMVGRKTHHGAGASGRRARAAIGGFQTPRSLSRRLIHFRRASIGHGNQEGEDGFRSASLHRLLQPSHRSGSDLSRWVLWFLWVRLLVAPGVPMLS